MNRFLNICFLLLLTHIATAQWTTVFETGTFFGLQDISAVNDNIAWANMTVDSVYRTIDGGESWDRIGLPDFETNYQISNIYALNEDISFICGQVIYTGVGPGIIYRTPDGGDSWENVLEIDSNCTFTMHMKNELEGIVAVFKSIYTGSSACSTLKTTDGGITWTYDGITEPAEYFAFDNDQLFGKEDEIWITDSDGNLYYSNDLGNTWDEIFSATFSQTISIPIFEHTDYGVAGGTLSFTQRLFRTTEGETFDDLSGILVQNVENIVLHDNEIWYTINPADDITIYYSSDSGETFEPQFSPASGIKEMTPSRNGIDIWALNSAGGGKIFKYDNPDIGIGDVNFDASDQSICPGSCINFSDLSTNFPTTWQWYFEGALTTISLDENPLEICYDSSGTFDVSLITTDADGISDTLLLPDFIYVYDEATAPSVYQFYDNVVCFGGLTFQWYKDGDIITGATESILPVTEDGNYSVEVTDINGCHSTANVDVLLNAIHFTASDTAICVGDCVSFADASVFEATAFSWTFDGGEPTFTTSDEPVVCYNEEGYYSVTLLLNFVSGYDSAIINNYMHVYTLPEIPTLSFSDYIITCSDAFSYQWYFNGELITGATEQSYIITDIVTQYGTYSVVITDEHGCIAENEIEVNFHHIYEYDLDSISIYPNPGSVDLNIICNNPIEKEIVIYNSIGEIMYGAKFFYALHVNTKEFTTGLYLIHLKSANNEVFYEWSKI